MYTVKAYDHSGLFKVIQSPLRFSDPFAGKTEKEIVHHEKRLSQSLSRSRAAVRDYVLANEWQYFVTLTIRKEVCNRYSLKDILSLVRPFFHEFARNNKGFKYVIVPERHKDGAYHFHGVMSGIEVCDLPPYAPKDALDAGYLHWPVWSYKFGFNTIGLVRDPVAVGFYVSKYITKDLAAQALEAGQHTYFHSRKLNKPHVVGWTYRENPFLNRCLTRRYEYCSTGWFRSEYEIVGSMLEELALVKDYYIVDTDDDVVALVGGDLEDSEFSALLDQYSLFDLWAIPAEGFQGSVLAG